jgi:hypothetical protein
MVDGTNTAVCVITCMILLFSFALMFPSLVGGGLDSAYSGEGFVYTPGYPTEQLCKVPLTTPSPREPGPADATLSSPRVPYHLLGDYMKPALEDGDERIANLTSECAYIADGERLIEKTGSYGQITNNYKRKNPDNGTTFLHELSVSFYK